MSRFRDRIRRTVTRLRYGYYGRMPVVAGLIAIVIGILAGTLMLLSPAGWTARFPAGDTLISNEVAYQHPNERGVRRSAAWIVTSGSLFARDHTGWTGPIDGDSPDLDSRRHTGSAVFRAVTRRDDFQNVVVTFDLYIDGMTTTRRTGRHSYDGVHVFLRYHNPQSLYAVSVDRRDRTVAIKIKRPGGPVDGGDYTTLGTAPLTVPDHHWMHETVRIVNEDGGVRITLWTNAREVISVLSNGSGQTAPLTEPGRVGLRGDNTEFSFRNFSVTAA